MKRARGKRKADSPVGKGKDAREDKHGRDGSEGVGERARESALQVDWEEKERLVSPAIPPPVVPVFPGANMLAHPVWTKEKGRV